MLLGIYVPGLDETLADWEPLIGRLRGDDSVPVEWQGWSHGLSVLTWRRSLAAEADKLRAFIDSEWKKYRYEGLILVGRSTGGLLVRQAYLMAQRATDGGLDPSPWAKAVARIVLFAAPNRGIDVRRPNFARRRYRMLRALGLHRVRAVYAFSIVGELLSGSAFIANLRIEWIRHFRQMNDRDLPDIVQVLGSNDGVVDKTDSLDLGQFSKLYAYSVPKADHGNLHIPETQSSNPEARYRLLADMIVRPLATRQRLSEQPQGKPKVVFVLHGIRASSETWAADVLQRIQELEPGTRVIRPNYGWISPLGFAIPRWRRRHIGWFQDMYAQELAANPLADSKSEIHFLGHSNGTYVLGHALEELPGMRFGRAVLAGSVLSESYPWNDRFDENRVLSIRNHCASRDWPVGFLCSWLRGLGMNDIGTAGHRGFLGVTSERLCEVKYHPGGHGSALGSDSLDTMVKFVLGIGKEKGKGDGYALPADLIPKKAVPEWFDILSRVVGHRAGAWVSLLFILALAVGGPWLLVKHEVFTWLVVGGVELGIIAALLFFQAVR